MTACCSLPSLVGRRSIVSTARQTSPRVARAATSRSSRSVQTAFRRPTGTCLAETANFSVLDLGDAQYVYAGPEPDLTTDQLQAVLQTAEGQPVYAETTAEPFPELYFESEGTLNRFILLDDRGVPADHRRDHRLRRSNLCLRSGRHWRSGSERADASRMRRAVLGAGRTGRRGESASSSSSSSTTPHRGCWPSPRWRRPPKRQRSRQKNQSSQPWRPLRSRRKTPIPPTETPVPPTETPIPPTETPVPPTETPSRRPPRRRQFHPQRRRSRPRRPQFPQRRRQFRQP